MIFCASLGGILYGYDIGVISGALLFVEKTIPMSRDQIGVIVGAVLAGCLVGTLVAGSLSDRFGRRTVILSACLVFAAGILTILSAQTFAMLLFARLLLGVGVGIVAVAVPLYLSEVAPARIRGRSLTLFQLLLNFGILLAYLIDLFFTPSGNWRGMFAVLFVPVALLFFGMLCLPETPRWLMAHRRHAKAKAALLKTRSENETVLEMESIQQSLQSTKGHWSDLFSRQLFLPLFVALAIAILNQLTGINVLLQYAPVVIKKMGLNSDVGSMLCTVGMGVVIFLGTAVSLMFIDWVGRRRLLMIGAAGIIVSYLYLALLSHLAIAASYAAWLSLIGLLSYIAFYAIGPGVVVWLAISELLPTKVRGKAVALCLFANSLSATLLSTFFLNIVHGIGLSGTYILLSVFTLLYFLVACFLLPETRGKTLEEIQQFFYRKFVAKRHLNTEMYDNNL